MCLVVLGKYVPDLESLGVLLGEAPPLEPHVGYYQRLLAEDEDEAAEIVDEYLDANPIEQVYDTVLVPALRSVQRDRGRGDRWWLGLRPVEAERYTAEGGDFARDEAGFRLGFEAALRAKTAGRAYDDVVEDLREQYADAYRDPAFRRGFERGRAYDLGARRADVCSTQDPVRAIVPSLVSNALSP